MLGEYVEPAGAEVLAIALALIDRLLGGCRFEKFEPMPSSTARRRAT